jgi:tetratricopeptide (TPR) repeat protein
MINRSANIYTLLLIFCASLFSFSQDEGLILLKDADDNQIKFENHYFESLKYKAIGNFTRAIIELENCQELFTDNKSIAFELSKNYFKLQKYGEAELYINKALEIDSENYWFLQHLKQVYLKQYNLQKAIEIQQKINLQNPKETEKLIPLFIQSKEFYKASKLVTDLESRGFKSSKLDRYKQVIESHLNKSKRIKTPKLKGELNTLTELKESFKNDKKYSMLLEILKQELINSNFDNLLVYSNEGLDLFPAQPTIYLINGKTLNTLKKYSEAIDVLNNGIDFVIDDVSLKADFHEQLAISFEALNLFEKANKHREKVKVLRKKE